MNKFEKSNMEQNQIKILCVKNIECRRGVRMIKNLILRIAFWCDKHLEWHNCETLSNDGCSNYGICKYCGAKCLQDSQGNWFEIKEE